MKRILFYGFLFTGIGFLLGELIFTNKINIIKKMSKEDTYYFLQEGVYSDYNNIQNNLIDINKKIITKKNNKYHVYVGITKDKEVLDKLINIYKEKHISVYPKEMSFNSKEFLINLEQFDLLIKETTDSDQILTIEEIVLSNYEEIRKKE